MITLVQTPCAPLLTIARTATNTVAISWSSFAIGFALQQNTNLALLNAWSLVSESAVTNGAQISVIVPVGTDRKFFRLKS